MLLSKLTLSQLQNSITSGLTSSHRHAHRGCSLSHALSTDSSSNSASCSKSKRFESKDEKGEMPNNDRARVVRVKPIDQGTAVAEASEMLADSQAAVGDD
uniref:Uncharacterized protein n=1 Tax=Peronospora matthiolae TaxID=2874970 RepID=A0AAV1U5F0_9STRA